MDDRRGDQRPVEQCASWSKQKRNVVKMYHTSDQDIKSNLTQLHCAIDR